MSPELEGVQRWLKEAFESNDVRLKGLRNARVVGVHCKKIPSIDGEIWTEHAPFGDIGWKLIVFLHNGKLFPHFTGKNVREMSCSAVLQGNFPFLSIMGNVPWDSVNSWEKSVRDSSRLAMLQGNFSFLSITEKFFLKFRQVTGKCKEHVPFSNAAGKFLVSVNNGKRPL